MSKFILNSAEKEQIVEYLTSGRLPLLGRREREKFLRRCVNLELDPVDTGKLLYKKNTSLKLRVFSEEEAELKQLYIKTIHLENGHPGRDRLRSVLVDKLYNFSREEIMSAFRACVECNARRLMNTRPVLTPIQSFFIKERYIFDLIDLRHYSSINMGYNWMLVGVDSFSKFAWTSPLKTKTKVEVISAIEDVFLSFDKPVIIHTDNGKEFVNDLMVDLCRRYNFRHVRGRARCPWVQGQVERLNQTLKFSISATCNAMGIRNEWIKVYRRITYTYNKIKHGTTRFSPFEVMFGISRENSLERYTGLEVANAVFEEFDLFDAEDGVLQDVEGEFNRWDMSVADEIRDEATLNTTIALQRMVERSMWPNDERPLRVGDKVMVRTYTDANTATRRRALDISLNMHVYRITGFDSHGNAFLEKWDDSSIILSLVPPRDLWKLN